MSSREIYARSLEAPTVAWVPHKDPQQPRSILGVVVDTYEIGSDYSDDAIPVVVIDTSDRESDPPGEEWMVRAYPAMLAGQLRRLRPRIGDTFGVAYHGRADERDDKSPHRYKVRRFEQAAGAEPAEDPDDERPPLNEPSDDELEALGRRDAAPAGDDIPF